MAAGLEGGLAALGRLPALEWALGGSCAACSPQPQGMLVSTAWATPLNVPLELIHTSVVPSICSERTLHSQSLRKLPTVGGLSIKGNGSVFRV